MNECHSCARECGVDRSCRAGFCKMGNRPVIARAGLPTQRVLAAMTMLQIKRLAVRENGNLRKL